MRIIAPCSTRNIGSPSPVALAGIALLVQLAVGWFACTPEPPGPADDDTTSTPSPGDDDASPGDDDTSPGDDDTSPGDDDTSPGDDDASPGDDDTSSGDDDATAGPQPTATPSPGTPTPPILPEGDYLVLVPDNQANRFKVIEPRLETLLYELDLSDVNAELCDTPMGCFIFGGSHALIDGHDYLDLTYGWPEGAGLGAGFQGNLDRVRISDPLEVRWQLRNLDFSSLPGGASAYCAVDPTDPCRSDPNAEIEAQGLCWVGDTHDFVVISDDGAAQIAEIMVADTDNHRMFKVTLDYAGGNTCGTVTAFVDERTTEDWEAMSQPNNVVPVEYEEREVYIVNMRAISGNHNGSGVVQLWELEPDGSWVLHWTFPEQPDSGEMRFFRQPHGGELIYEGHPDGDLYRFADSAGLADSDDFNGASPPGGKCPVLLFRDILEPPDYLHDLYQPAEEGVWGYPRQITRVGDGTLIVTDSGCQASPDCTHPARLIWLVDAEDFNSSKEGYWTEDFSEVELLDQTENVLKDFECGLQNPYWAEVIPVESFGEELLEAVAKGGSPCP